MTYLYIKALHIIFMVCWFAGLFYIVRLFVYNSEANTLQQPAKSILQDQYKIMTTRLWNIITWPACIITTLCGVTLIYLNPSLLTQPWMHIKLFFVFLLFLYHLRCNTYVNLIKNDKLNKSSTFFRIWNEGATLILFAIVFIVILKSTFNWIFGLLGLLSLSFLLMTGIKLYKAIRDSKNKKI
ncbi:CopD family protein [Myroides sp. LJL110]